MIEAVWAKTQDGQTLELDLKDSGTNQGIYVFNLEGIGSPVATINSSGGPALAGVRVNSTKIDGRHLTFSVAINAVGDREEEARALLYKFFPVGQKILFGIRTDRREVYAEAYVEQNPFAHFSKVENSVIALLCPNAFFTEVAETTHTMGIDTGIPLFSFPFSNESLEIPLIKFGETALKPAFRIEYDGVETGVEIEIHFLYNWFPYVSIFNSNGDQTMQIDARRALNTLDPNRGVQPGDRIFINTKVGQKHIEYRRAGAFLSPVNMLSGVTLDSNWITLKPGTNRIIVLSSDTGFPGDWWADSYMETTLAYHKLLEGV